MIKKANGRPPMDLMGITPRGLVSMLDASSTSLRTVRSWISGESDMGIERLHRLLEARPDLDARELVAECRRTSQMTCDRHEDSAEPVWS